MRRGSARSLWLMAALLLAGGLLFARMAPLGAADGQAGVAAPAPEGHPEGHHSPVAPVLVAVVIIILAARLGGHLFDRIGQPAVMGELLVGILLGNLSLLGFHGLDFLKIDRVQVSDPLYAAGVTIDELSRLGVLLLLFEVGLETSVADLRKVGASAFLVATMGVIAPMALGWFCGRLLLPSAHWAVHMFLGATLTATSVGITARVLRDLGRMATQEAKIILGAAVIDDVLGLLVLALAQGVITALATGEGAATIDWLDLAIIVGKAVAFLLGSLVLGQYISRPLFKVASFLKGGGVLVVTALAFCFAFSWLADAVGLAPIVGAFAAGLILEKVHYRELAGQEGHHIEEVIRPIGELLVPIFFVMIGFQVDMSRFAHWEILGLAAALTFAAFLGKQVCGLGVLERGLDRLSVGIGMVPRGEVGLIVAAIGRQMRLGEQRIVDDGTYAALVLTVMATTVVTPPLLKWSLARKVPPGKVPGKEDAGPL
jgi:Kef-type K+ transport system membrane component KefB